MPGPDDGRPQDGPRPDGGDRLGVDELTREHDRLERETREIAEHFRARGADVPPEEAQHVREEISRRVERLFEIRGEIREREMRRLESTLERVRRELERVRAELDRRAEQREAMIKERVEGLFEHGGR